MFGRCHCQVDSQILEELKELHRKVDEIMTVQADVDAATTEINSMVSGVATAVTQLQSDVTAIQQELQNLPASVDTSALDAAVASAASTVSNLNDAVQGVTNLAPQPQAPTA